MLKLERIVFEAIFRNTYDEPAFNEAIKKVLPDAKYQKELADRIDRNEQEVDKKEKQYREFVRKVRQGIMDDDEIVMEEKTAAKAEIELLRDELEEDERKLESLPKVETVEREARRTRQGMLDHFGSEERMKKMSYADKVRDLHWLCDGYDGELKKRRGIYIKELDKSEYEIEFVTKLF